MSEPLTDERLREYRELAKQWCEARSKATPGPAYASFGDDSMCMSCTGVTTSPDGMGEGMLGDSNLDESTVIAITLYQSPRVADIADKRWDENAELIVRAWNDRPEVAIQALLGEVERLKAYPAALERTERGLTKPCRLGSLAALLSELLCGRYAETAASPKAMKRILQDVADLYRGLVQAGGHDASGYFPSLPPLSSEEAETLWAECLEEARSQS